jgi:hypothetical protein
MALGKAIVKRGHKRARRCPQEGLHDQGQGRVAVIDSPRGTWTMRKSHNPVQNNYLREVSNNENKMIGIAAKALADSGGLPHVSF